MKTIQACSHTLGLMLIGAVTIYINGSSVEQPLRGYDKALLPFLQKDNPYLLNGMDLSLEGMGAPLPLGQIRGEDLSGMDLRKAMFSHHGLHGLRLRGSHLSQANFSCVPLKNVDFSGADLHESRFDFSSCQSQLPPLDKKCPEGIKLLGGTSSCFILKADLVGANLSGALLQGKLSKWKVNTKGEIPKTDPFLQGKLSDKWKVNTKGEIPKSNPCEQWLVIQGKLDGARFERATLRCVALINQSPSPKGAGRQAYAGISFIQTNLDHLLLESGNFLFSDFWQAQVSHLAVRLPAANLRFSSLAELQQCPTEGCLLEVIPAGPLASFYAIKNRLSLNVMGSRIHSNLPLAASSSEWPALMCNNKRDEPIWTSVPMDSIGSNLRNPPPKLPDGLCESGRLVASRAGSAKTQ
ncbi:MULTISPECIES: pentapeptide repeat-containing protein [unclassified Synechococcus]|uniref:pentapeptide repeat-containing protein n=1 Tax=unclassified Synechococcus TaxID=2626047 RepID=UPI0021A3A51C|nr:MULTISPECIES: pentapeptide repeat-containing protein [unclassified Synechococcus]MCT0211967.1 pentapeptide repeat-containing protein [Synechococcus sp. CS-1326]MCT0232379.1 pentapeptide repeat-containing protein [Synechococcus sp. CS-1327]